MRYTDLAIQTIREAPNNARTPGFAFLVRAGYLTREDRPTALGEQALAGLERLAGAAGEELFIRLEIPVLRAAEETFFALPTGTTALLRCPACVYAAREALARSRLAPLPAEDPLPMQPVETPECPTIEALASYLEVPAARTAKAMLFTRHSDEKLVFAVLRGDTQLSQAKLESQLGRLSPASENEIVRAGAVPGYASPVGLREALVVVDELIPAAGNLVAGANRAGFHTLNVNYGRDYTADLVCDLRLARAGEACPECGSPLEAVPAELLAAGDEYHSLPILHAVAEVHHDERGLALPPAAAPFALYLMHVPGKQSDTRLAARALYERLREAGVRVLFDDREERAGVKFNDADLIGCPLRLTVGERGLAQDAVEMKARTAAESTLQPLEGAVQVVRAFLA